VLLFAASGLSIVEKGTMAWCARLVGVPALIFPRGDVEHRQGLTRLVLHWALRGADKVCCQGPTWQRFAVTEVGFALPDAPVLPNWTARPVLLAAGRTRRYEVSAVVRLVFIGWLERTKGVLELLTACARLKDLCAFELTLVGRGQMEPEARAFVSSHGLQDRVHFAGWLKDDEVDSILETSDALVLPSWTEGMPNAVIEAMAAGLPVVVTAVGNVPDFVTNNAEALLINPRDVEALTEALQRVLTDPALRERMGRAGHSLATTVFSPESASDELAHELEDSMAKARRLREAHDAMNRFS
jgi:glycosyltransferase involved in cell wall biosynthesis